MEVLMLRPVRCMEYSTVRSVTDTLLPSLRILLLRLCIRLCTAGSSGPASPTSTHSFPWRVSDRLPPTGYSMKAVLWYVTLKDDESVSGFRRASIWAPKAGATLPATIRPASRAAQTTALIAEALTPSSNKPWLLGALFRSLLMPIKHRLHPETAAPCHVPGAYHVAVPGKDERQTVRCQTFPRNPSDVRHAPMPIGRRRPHRLLRSKQFIATLWSSFSCT